MAKAVEAILVDIPDAWRALTLDRMLESGWPVKLTEDHDITRVQALVAAHTGGPPGMKLLLI